MLPYSVLDALYRHHLWANLQLLEACSALSEEQLQSSAVGGYGSIDDTLQHLVTSDESYLYRIRTGNPIERPESRQRLTMAEMIASVQASGAGLIEWASKVEASDSVEIQWNNGSINKPVQVPKSVVLTQVINHATEHRTQIMAILTGLGIEPPELSGWAYFEEQLLT